MSAPTTTATEHTDRTQDGWLPGIPRRVDRRILGSNPGDRPRRKATTKPVREPILNLRRPIATPLEGLRPPSQGGDCLFEAARVSQRVRMVAIQRSELVLRRRLTVAPRDTTSRDGMCAQSVRYPELAMVDGGRPTTCAWSAAIGLDLRCYRVANSLAHQPADVGLDSAGGNPTALPDLHA